MFDFLSLPSLSHPLPSPGNRPLLSFLASPLGEHVVNGKINLIDIFLFLWGLVTVTRRVAAARPSGTAACDRTAAGGLVMLGAGVPSFSLVSHLLTLLFLLILYWNFIVLLLSLCRLLK